MLSIDLQQRIWKDFHEGKPQTNARKYSYTLEYSEGVGEMPWKIIRAQKDGSTSWEAVQELADCMQFIPKGSCIKILRLK